jgi:drug/metabolite transporter (DMT)-like permease
LKEKLLQNQTHGKIDVFGTVSGLLAVACWGSGPVFIRFLAGYLDAWSQNFWRYATALIFWLPFLFIVIRRGQVSRNLWKWALVPGIANVAMQCFWGWTFYFIEPGLGSLISRSSLIWTMMFSLIYFADERPLVKSARFWLGIVLSITGLIGVVFLKEGFTARTTMTGTILMLSAGITWAVYSISIRILFKDIDARVSFSVVCVYTTAGLAVAALIFGKPGQLFGLAAWPWACMIISAVLSIALAHTFYYASIKSIGATIPAVMLQLSPFATLVLSVPIMGERMNLWQWVSGVVLVAGSILAIWAQEHLGKNIN